MVILYRTAKFKSRQYICNGNLGPNRQILIPANISGYTVLSNQLMHILPFNVCSLFLSLSHSHTHTLTVGMYFCFTKLTDHNIFIILYGLTSVYFAVSHVTNDYCPSTCISKNFSDPLNFLH